VVFLSVAIHYYSLAFPLLLDYCVNIAYGVEPHGGKDMPVIVWREPGPTEERHFVVIPLIQAT